MIVQEAGLIFTKADSTIQSCIYHCNPDIVINTGRSLVIQCKDSISNFLYKSNGENRIILSSSPGSEVFESAGFGDGRILINSTAGDSLSYTYEYYLTDHLGSTRMVVNDQNIVNEAVMYHPYGTMVSVGSISSPLPVREKFTGKEFDEEGGSGTGISGMGLFYFGKRYYNPEVGIWLSTDPKDQLFNPYGYSTNPINTIDPDGQWILGALIGGAIGFAGGGLIGGAINGEGWSWGGAFQGMMTGASLGSGIENAIGVKSFGLGISAPPSRFPNTAYGRGLMVASSKSIGTFGTLADATGLLTDTYLIDRAIGGDKAVNHPVSHTYAAITDDAGNVIETYSWGNTYDSKKMTNWAPVNQKNDFKAAQQAIDKGYAKHIAGKHFDPYVTKAYNQLRVTTPDAKWRLWNNCKHRALELINTAVDLVP